MPKWGLAMKEGSVTSWLKNEGDKINKGETFVEIETEKVVNEFESPEEGILIKKVIENDIKAPVGSLIAILGNENTDANEVEKFVEDFQSNFTPPSDDDEDSNLEKIIQIQNIDINYLQLGENNSKNIVFVHGFGGDLNNWMFNQEELSSSFNTFSIDLPGHGKSSKNIDQGSLGYLSNIVSDFCKQNNLEKICLVGHSLGGGICLNIALENSELVESLVLISPIGLGKEIDNYVEEFIKSESRRDLKPQLEKLYFNKELITRDLVNEVLKFKRLDGVEKALHMIKDETLIENNNQKTFFGNKIETLKSKISIIWGENDEIVPISHIKELPSNVETHIFKESGHMSHIEKSKEVNEIIVKLN